MCMTENLSKQLMQEKDNDIYSSSQSFWMRRIFSHVFITLYFVFIVNLNILWKIHILKEISLIWTIIVSVTSYTIAKLNNFV